MVYNDSVKRQQETPEKKVLAYIRENNLIKGGDKVVVAVSGGPDSVCLLHILYGLRKELNIKLHIAHLNHQLRGAESDADAEYVRKLAGRMKIPATLESADVKAYRKEHRLTLEEAAREVRYCFIASVTQKEGAVCAAVGHTSNDHAETVLMHLIRGSGIKGLRGLAPQNTLKTQSGDLKVIRPLLELTREETVAYCKEHGLETRTDSSNLSTQPFRNKIRRKLLPELKKYNPQIMEALLRTARSAAADLDFIEQEAEYIFDTIGSNENGAVTLNKKLFLSLHPAVQRQILRDAIEKLLGSLKDIEAGHIEDMMEALEKPAGKTIGLPFGLKFYIDYERYILSTDNPLECPLPELKGEFTLNIPGKTTASGWEVEASYVPSPAEIRDEGGFTACFDASKTGKKLTVRAMRPGDRFQPLGMKQEKKLSRFMTDERIPQAWRNACR